MKLYTYEDAFKAIYDYIEGFYNPIRVHSSIGYLSPDNFEKSISSSDTLPKSGLKIWQSPLARRRLIMNTFCFIFYPLFYTLILQCHRYFDNKKIINVNTINPRRNRINILSFCHPSLLVRLRTNGTRKWKRYC